MQEIEYISCFYHPVFFSVPKEVGLNSRHYLIMKTHNKRKLQNIATNHAADTDFKDFIKIYRKSTSQRCSF